MICSKNIAISPPQAKPTSQALSFETLNSIFLKGWFFLNKLKHSLTTAVSTHPPDTDPEKSSYAKYPNPASRYAVVGAYVAKFKKEVRVAITGAGNSVFRSKELETALSSNFSSSVIDNASVSSKGLNSDIHASAEYRAHLIKVMTRKAVSSC